MKTPFTLRTLFTALAATLTRALFHTQAATRMAALALLALCAAASADTVVVDTTPPQITGHSDVTALATSPAGAVVTYTAPTANDTVDGAVTVTCVPASGTLFPLGLTPVNCTATDSHGNTAHSNFNVIVSRRAPTVAVAAAGAGATTTTTYDFDGNSGGLPAGFTHLAGISDPNGTVVEGAGAVTITDAPNNQPKLITTAGLGGVTAVTLTVDITSMSGVGTGDPQTITGIGAITDAVLVVQFTKSTRNFQAFIFGAGGQSAFTLASGEHVPGYAGGPLSYTLAAGATSFRLTCGSYDSGAITYASAGLSGLTTISGFSASPGVLIGTAANNSGNATVVWDRVAITKTAVGSGAATADEGSPATKAGTFADADGNETVTLTASSGAITQDNTAGTWSWTKTSDDGPDAETITITATDTTAATAMATFDFEVTNVAPTAAISAPATAEVDTAVSFTFTATDVSAADQAAGFTWTINYGDGPSPGDPQPYASPLGRTHTYGAPGTYTVTATSRDKDGGSSAAATRSITILDVTAPVISDVPADIMVAATSAVVTFTSPTALDTVDGAVAVTCVPASGSTFVIGTTTVICTATDAAGNSASASFTVTVTPVSQTISFTLPATATASQTIQLSATASSGLPVGFYIFGPGPGSIDGNNVLSFSGVGRVTVRAFQAGNESYGGTTEEAEIMVTAAGQTIDFTLAATATTTDTIALSATGGASGNAVTFSVFSGPGSISGNTLTFTGAGSVVVRASQAGDANYADATPVDATVTVTAASPHAPVAVDDAVTTTTGDTTLYPLANDTDADGDVLTIASVSNPAVTIAGRALIIPLGTPSFTYTVSDGSGTDTGAVTVIAGTPVVGATIWAGLLYDVSGDIVGSMAARKTRTGSITASLKLGAEAGRASLTLNDSGEATATISLGALSVTLEASTGRLTASLAQGANTYTGSLRPSQLSATPGQHNIALASVDAAIPGGGYARAFVKADGVVVVKGLLPDGRSFSNATRLADNGSFVIYAPIAKTQPSAIVGGEFIIADLTSTDVTGELAWAKAAQARGLHVAGVDTTLTANGCIYTPASTLPDGSVTVTASGGNLAVPLSVTTTATAGVPTPSVAFPSWKVVSPRGVFTGLFSARVKIPAIARSVGATGVYLPKSNSAWGYFPGTTVGGRIQLTQP